MTAALYSSSSSSEKLKHSPLLSGGGVLAGGDGERGSPSCTSTEFSLTVLLQLKAPPSPRLLMLLPPVLLREPGLPNAASPPPRLVTPNTSGGRERGGRGGSEGDEGQRRNREQRELVAKQDLKKKKKS